MTDNERDKKEKIKTRSQNSDPCDRGSGLCAYDRSCGHYNEKRKHNSMTASEKA